MTDAVAASIALRAASATISPRAIFASPAGPGGATSRDAGPLSTSVICPSLSVTALKLASRSIWYTTSETSPRMCENAELL